MNGVSDLGSGGPWLSWGLCSFYPSGFLVWGPFGDGVWGFGCVCWGFGVVPECVESDAWSWDSADLEISCYKFLNTV